MFIRRVLSFGRLSWLWPEVETPEVDASEMDTSIAEWRASILIYGMKPLGATGHSDTVLEHRLACFGNTHHRQCPYDPGKPRIPVRLLSEKVSSSRTSPELNVREPEANCLCLLGGTSGQSPPLEMIQTRANPYRVHLRHYPSPKFGRVLCGREGSFPATATFLLLGSLSVDAIGQQIRASVKFQSWVRKDGAVGVSAFVFCEHPQAKMHDAIDWLHWR